MFKLNGTFRSYNLGNESQLSWNDTNAFPMTTFYWQGIDGSKVLTHFNRTHQGPSPEMYQAITGGAEAITEKRVSGMRLFSLIFCMGT